MQYGMITVPLTRARATFANLEVDFDSLPENTRRHLVTYGLRQNLNDAHRSAKTTATAESMALKRLDKLKAGTFAVREVTDSDPVMAEAIAIVLQSLKAEIKASGQKVGDYKAAELDRMAEEYLESEDSGVEAVMEEAKKRVEARKTQPTFNVGGFLKAKLGKPSESAESENKDSSEPKESSGAESEEPDAEPAGTETDDKKDWNESDYIAKGEGLLGKRQPRK